MENWAKVLRKICPKIRSKHVWILLVTIFGFFGTLKIFGFFQKISNTRPSMENWSKIFRQKLPQNTFKTRLATFGNDFRLFWNFENF